MRKIKDDWWAVRMKELQTYKDLNDTHNLYKGIRSIIGPIKKSLNVVKNKEGEPLINKSEQLERWKEHFQEVLNQDNPVKSNIPAFNVNLTEDITDESPSEEEINKAVKFLKYHKSAGDDEIVAEMIKAGGPTSTNILHRLLKEIWEKKEVPQDWRDATVIPIHKKGDKSCCTNYI